MMFILSKIISFFIDPVIWIVLLLTIGWLVRNRRLKKRLYLWSIIVFLFFSNGWIVNNIWNLYQSQPVEIDTIKPCSAGILLGGLAGYDESLKKGFFNQTSDRFIQTVRLFETGKISNIVVSGGNAIFVKESGYNEADFLVKNLLDLQIPSTHIISETKSRNTLENAAFCKKMLDSMGFKGPYVLVTSAIHMPRALKVFKKAGVEVIPFPSNYVITESATEFSFRYLVPSANALILWSVLLREWLGHIQLAIAN
jgi:uncharacterized SAM-binding protein YcdF (DUF218 family)